MEGGVGMEKKVSNKLYYRQSENQSLYNAINSMRDSSNHKFKYAIWQVEMGGNEFVKGRIIRYEMDIVLNPNAPESEWVHKQVVVSDDVARNTYSIFVQEVEHFVKVYHDFEVCKAILAQLTSDEIDMLMRFKENQYINLEDHIDAKTAAKLSVHDSVNPQSAPRFIWGNKNLVALQKHGLILIELLGSVATAFLIEKGLIVLEIIEKQSEGGVK